MVAKMNQGLQTHNSHFSPLWSTSNQENKSAGSSSPINILFEAQSLYVKASAVGLTQAHCVGPTDFIGLCPQLLLQTESHKSQLGWYIHRGAAPHGKLFMSNYLLFRYGDQIFYSSTKSSFEGICGSKRKVLDSLGESWHVRVTFQAAHLPLFKYVTWSLE